MMLFRSNKQSSLAFRLCLRRSYNRAPIFTILTIIILSISSFYLFHKFIIQFDYENEHIKSVELYEYKRGYKDGYRDGYNNAINQTRNMINNVNNNNNNNNKLNNNIKNKNNLNTNGNNMNNNNNLRNKNHMNDNMNNNHNNINIANNNINNDNKNNKNKNNMNNDNNLNNNNLNNNSIIWSKRRSIIRTAIKEAWNIYETNCFGRDEVKPISKSCSGDVIWLDEGLTLIDSMDTLYIANLMDEYKRAEKWVVDHLDFDRNRTISLFESTIRIVGGLLSANDLSNNPVIIKKLNEYASRVLPIFNTPSGIPYAGINLRTGQTKSPHWTGGSSLLSEVGSLQLEFMHLSYISKNDSATKLWEKADNVIEYLYKMKDRFNGLYPTFIDKHTGQFSNQMLTFGAMADSFYEYLLKVWILSGKKNDKYRIMYINAIKEMERKLLKDNGKFLYMSDMNYGRTVNEMDHLECFIPGMLALGAHHGAVDKELAKHHMNIAERLVKTCTSMYFQTQTGLAGEDYTFDNNGNMRIKRRSYRLRPETVESLFILYRLTGKNIYREWGWKIFQSIQKHCHVNTGGYSGLNDVTNGIHPQQSDFMESFFIAETLKYLYLLFSPSNIYSLDEYVFNTEAHPLKIHR